MLRLLKLLLTVVLISVTAADAAALRTLDRTLYIRSIPEVKGYNSHIYEVLMTQKNNKVSFYIIIPWRGGTQNI
jgi:hypothetical protein